MQATNPGSLSAACLLILISGHANAARDWNANASLSARTTYTSNVDLSASDEQETWVYTIAPTLTFDRKGKRIQASVNYSANMIDYSTDQGDDRIDHSLNGNLDTELIEDRLFINTSVSHSQELIDRTSASTGNTINASDNFTDTTTISITPRWQQRIGRYTSLGASLSYDEVHYQGQNQDSRSTSYNFFIDTKNDPSKLFWTLTLRQSATRPDQSTDNKSDSASLKLSYRYSAQLVPSLTAGYTDNHLDNPTDDHAAKGEFWGADISWRPNPRNSVALSYNSRLQTNESYGIDIQHKRSHSDWSISYQESITTSRQQLLSRSATREQGGLQQLVPIASLTNEQFIENTLQANVSGKKGKSGLSLGLFNTTREYQSSNTNEEESGINAGWTLRLGGRSDLSLRGSWSRIEPEASSPDTTESVVATFSRKLTRKVTVNGSMSSTQRKSDTASRKYKDLSAVAGINMAF